VPHIGFDRISTVPFTSRTRSSMLVRPKPLRCLAASMSKPFARIAACEVRRAEEVDGRSSSPGIRRYHPLFEKFLANAVDSNYGRAEARTIGYRPGRWHLVHSLELLAPTDCAVSVHRLVKLLEAQCALRGEVLKI
jgi:hypothetical protein